MFVVKVPGINNSASSGCERAGNAIIKELKELHSNEAGKPIDARLLDLEEIHLDNSNLKLTNELIYENALESFEENPKVIFLGGDHYISFSLLRAFQKYCENARKQPCLIVFDSHLDCINEKKQGFHTSRSWLRELIDKGFPSENILIVGARNFKQEEIIFAEKHKLRRISMNQLEDDLDDTCDIIMEFASGKELYISIDMDIIDSAFAPNVSFPEIGGLSSRQFLYLINRINKMKNLRAIDLVEINAEKDISEKSLTIKLGAKIIGEFL